MKNFIIFVLALSSCLCFADDISAFAKKSLREAQTKYSSTLQTNENLLSAKKAEFKKICEQADLLQKELEQLKTQAVAMSLENGKCEYYRELLREISSEISKVSAERLSASATGNEVFESVKNLLENKYKQLKTPISSEDVYVKELNSDKKISGKSFVIGGLRYFVANNYPKNKAGFLSEENIVYASQYGDDIYNFFKGNSKQLPADTSFGELLKNEKSNLSVLAQIKKGGVWIYPILLLGALSIVVAVVKFVSLWSVKIQNPSVNAKNLQFPYRGISQAVANAKTEQEKEDFAFVAIARTETKLRRGLSVLTITSAVAPLFGLLGTVSGIIKTFADIASASAQTRQISDGIAEALITTEYGLIVAIPALILGALLSRRVKAIKASVREYAIKCVAEK